MKLLKVIYRIKLTSQSIKLGENKVEAIFSDNVLSLIFFNISSKGEIGSIVINTKEAVYNKNKSISVLVKNHNNVTVKGLWFTFT